MSSAVVSLKPMLVAASSHFSTLSRYCRPLTLTHLTLVVGRWNPNGPTVFFRQEPPPTVSKQIKPVEAVHSSLPHVHVASFKAEPFVTIHAAPSTVVGTTHAIKSNSVMVVREFCLMLVRFRRSCVRCREGNIATAESKDHFLLQTLPLNNVYATYACLNTHTMNHDNRVIQDGMVK